jgi:hypothetical protein
VGLGLEQQRCGHHARLGSGTEFTMVSVGDIRSLAIGPGGRSTRGAIRRSAHWVEAVPPAHRPW